MWSPAQGVVTNFEIFRMREKQVPVDVVEMKGQEHSRIECFFKHSINKTMNPRIREIRMDTGGVLLCTKLLC